MTEPEAKTKWCPFIRLTKPDESALTSWNRSWNRVIDGGPLEETVCIGSACMAWRWDRPQEIDVPIASDDGHCGLAGPVAP